jgi:hypothetical protein
VRYKVLKGTKNKPELDSTWPDKKRAESRAKNLRTSYMRQKIEVWVEPCNDEDPTNYRKPIKGPYTNYDRPCRPKRIR